jgi:hypothetical protein
MAPHGHAPDSIRSSAGNDASGAANQIEVGGWRKIVVPADMNLFREVIRKSALDPKLRSTWVLEVNVVGRYAPSNKRGAAHACNEAGHQRIAVIG